MKFTLKSQLKYITLVQFYISIISLLLLQDKHTDHSANNEKTFRYFVYITKLPNFVLTNSIIEVHFYLSCKRHGSNYDWNYSYLLNNSEMWYVIYKYKMCVWKCYIIACIWWNELLPVRNLIWKTKDKIVYIYC